jgi:hypothetical protein
MKYILTETQLKLLVEQAPPTLTASKPTSALQPTTNVKSGTINSTFGTGEGDLHSFMTVLQIGTAFIPLVGPFISMGIGLADAAMYYNEGDKKTAGLIGVFSMIPGIGGLASKMGLSSWTAKALGEIGKKISLGSKLSPAEIQVGKKVAEYRNLIQQEIAKVGTKAGVSAAKQNVKKRLVKKAVANKTAKFVGTKVAPYVGVGVAYDKGYDAVTGNKSSPSLEDLVKVDKQTIAPTNLQASKELDF